MKGLTTLGCALAVPPPVAPPPIDPAMAPYAHPGGLVDIGGRRIDLRCEGKTGPVVILMAGLGGFSLGWYKVQPAIAKRARTCAFDTASYGYSDPAPLPQSLPDVVDDLHATLVAAHLPGPYILVAHSIAGIEARLFAQRWPKEVAGMVLVDSSFAGQRMIQARLPGFASLDPARSQAKALDCIIKLATPGFGPASPAYKDCVYPPPPDAPASLVAAWRGLFRPSTAASNISLAEGLSAPFLDSVDHLDLGDKPLVVLTAGKTDPNPAHATYAEAFRKIWLERHEGFAHMSTRGVHRIVAGAGHGIQFDKPDAVIDAVDQVLDQSAGH
jgi:pimeloyl-ACP methyl ester carboxylesterase